MITTFGFTASRQGINNNQIKLLIQLLIDFKQVTTALHGMCVGGDDKFHQIVREFRPDIKIIGHPPLITNQMAKDLDCDEILRPKEYITRNHDIVDLSDILIGCPKGDEVTRSGTWSTIRYSLKLNKSTIILR